MSMTYYTFLSNTILPSILLVNLVLVCWTFPLGAHNNSSKHLCHKSEHLALLLFKQSFTIDENQDLYNPITPKTSSWKTGTDCCEWDGIKCDPSTHHVIAVNLTNSGLSGSIHSNSTLFLLGHLRVAILCQNDMSSSIISPKFGELLSLEHLDLSFSGFTGQVPSEIARLTQLRLLDLSGNEGLEMPNFRKIITNLTNLRHVDLSFMSLNTHVPQTLSNLSSLAFLGLAQCELQGELPIDILNLPYLKFFDISYNYVYSNPKLFHYWRLGSSSLEYLDLSFVNFSSSLPPFLPRGQSHHLSVLRLEGCTLHGPIPAWVLKTSQQIDLNSNHFTSHSSDFVSTITSSVLAELDLQNNNLQGNISLFVEILRKFPSLEGVMLSNSGLSVTLTDGPDVDNSSTWANSLEALLLSNTSIHGDLPSWIQHAWKDSINVLDLSHNSITGGLPKDLPWSNLVVFDISSNLLKGPLPLPDIGVFEFSAANNKFTGPIDSSICDFAAITLLDLSNNSLSGEFPQCLGNLSDDLSVLNLGSNNIHGTLPTAFSKCGHLEYLDLSNNLMRGIIPRSLSSCHSLEILNLRHNEFRDEFPFWLQNLSQMQILDLGSNNFHGPIPYSNAKRPFPLLQVIDLSNNNFSGKLPSSYINNFRAMKNMSDNHGDPQYLSTIGNKTFYSYSISLTFNGVDRNYGRIISSLTTIDLSNNAFEGDIPHIIGQLVGLHGLNLSHNRLTGHIPASIGNLLLLDFLDLSCNQLTGKIPQELATLTYLGVFNVSHNQLVGPVPHGNNFDTFQTESYKGNLGLCGFPLPECKSRHLHDHSPSSDHSTDQHVDDDTGDNGEMLSEWKITLIGYGCGTIVGAAWGYYLLSIGKPFWFAKLAYSFEQLVLQLFEKRFGNGVRRHRSR